MRLYPDRNPFPFQGTLSIEGTDRALESDDPVTTVTVLLDPVLRTLELTRRFLDRFSATEKTRGLAAVLRGDHGTGKTHTLYFVQGQVQSGNLTPLPGKAVFKPVQLYAKAEGPSFLDVYQRLMKNVEFDVLREMGRRSLGVVAGEEFGKRLDDRPKGLETAERLRQDPGQVEKLFTQLAVEPGMVQERQAAEIESAAGKVSEDFRRVISALSGPLEQAQAAYNWLTGRELTLDQSKGLNVSAAIASADDSKWAIQLLATIFRRTGQPLIIYIDQYEKLVLDKNSELASHNIGRLHSLVEVISRENGMLVLSGNEEAWRGLPRDLRERVGDNVVDFTLLTLREAMQLVGLYLHPKSDSFERTVGRVSPEELFPFTSDSVNTIVEFASGNIRRFLRICAAVFDAASPNNNIIDRALVTGVLQSGSHLYFTKETVADEIRQSLVQHGLEFRNSFDVDGIRVDFAVLAPTGSPVMMIRISKALFYDDEAQTAIDHLNLAERLQQRKPPARFVLVVLGYVSREVTAKLSQLVHDLIVYRKDDFRSRFDDVLKRIPPVTETTSETRQEREVLEQQLAEVRQSLQIMLKSREEETRALEERLAKLLRNQQAERINEKRQSSREAWAQERKNIEERMRDTRSQRRKAGLDQLEHLRQKAENEEQFRRYLIGAAAAVVVFVGGIVLFRGYWRLETVTFFLAPLAAIGFSIIAWGEKYFGLAARRNLVAPVSSVDDLNRVGHAFLRTVQERSRRRLLRSAHPHLRYAGALAASSVQDKHELIGALLSERSGIVRTALARQMGARDDLVSDDVERLAGSIPEVAYIVERTAKRLQPRDLPPLLETLRVIAGAPPSSPPARFALLVAAELKGIKTGNAMVHALAEDFISGRDPSDCQGLSELSVREGLQELSFFENGGLGTFDELLNIQFIDQLYVFFCQIRFLMERDLLLTSQQSDRKMQPAAGGAARDLTAGA